MGTSPAACLFYGFKLEHSGNWEVAGVEEWDMWIPSWLDVDPDDDVAMDALDENLPELVEARLLAELENFRDQHPGYDIPELADDYHRRRDAALKRIGVELVDFGSYDVTMYALVAHRMRAGYGFTELPSLLELIGQEMAWDARLAAALTALDIQPTGKQGWFLSASYG